MRIRPAIAAAASAALLVLAPSAAGAAAPAGGHGHGHGPSQGPTRGPCAYTPLEDRTYSTWVGLPPDPRRTPDRGHVRVTLRTNQGTIPLMLDRRAAPCTVQSITFLVRRDYFDDTRCHRLTAYRTPPAALSVLQCGDPLGTGNGDPGYSFADELDSARALENWPGFPDGSRKVYPRGTIAMANAGPDTNGSQFFLVYEDSRLRPDYTVFGRVSESGMRVLDRIAAGGIDPGTDGTPEDGAPARPVLIRSATTHR
ncbi:peptidylprolyl isomerase [Phycicoccus sp. HDW14]|uniref:peptidylprolyl isomerase n=1 Tax=Phycicoccus sp. HDW14 TaxID=2714941 RepID=UPI001408D057|nr:peptidylprolyl isomerase [Phycicoccus sp. HDW14]QIM21090.1 peptidylprolyl isomerase [Phycicoccus sp. HDW14]